MVDLMSLDPSLLSGATLIFFAHGDAFSYRAHAAMVQLKLGNAKAVDAIMATR
jgi:hypothetical protein